MVDVSKRDHVLRTYEQAMQRLDRGDYEGALRDGESIRDAGFSGAFEVLACAHLGLGDHAAAIAVLREGTRLAPGVWVLWKLLGDALSDARAYGEAHEAYGRAAGCPHADAALIAYNRAILFAREARYDEALAQCAALRGPGWEARGRALEVAVLNDAGRCDDALAAADAFDAAARAHADDGSVEALRRQVGGQRARALWHGRRDRAGALAAAHVAVEGGFDAGAAAVLREIADLRTRTSRRLRVMLQGRSGVPIEGTTRHPGFFRVFDVVADTPDEALGFAAAFHPEGERATLRVEAVAHAEPAPDAPKGVYAASGYSYFG